MGHRRSDAFQRAVLRVCGLAWASALGWAAAHGADRPQRLLLRHAVAVHPAEIVGLHNS